MAWSELAPRVALLYNISSFSSFVMHKEQLIAWSNASKSFDLGQFQEALQGFQDIASNAKMFFNMGVIYTRLGDLDRAIFSFTRAISHDCYMAVAFFTRASCHYHNNQFEDSLRDCETSIKLMRGNSYIDYSQLGLNYILRISHILHNKVLCHLKLGRHYDAMDEISRLETLVDENDMFASKIYETCHSKMKAHNSQSPISIDLNLIFRPSDAKTQFVGEVDYLGTSKVVATVNEQDTYAGFSGSLLKRSNSAARIADLGLECDQNSDLLEIRRSQSVNRSPVMPSPRKSSIDLRILSSSSKKSTTLAELNTRNMSSPELFSPMDSPLWEQASSQIHVKVHYNQARIILIPQNSNFQYLSNKIYSKFRPKNDVKIWYKDDDEEMCLLADDEDLECALVHCKITNNIKRIELWVQDEQ